MSGWTKGLFKLACAGKYKTWEVEGHVSGGYGVHKDDFENRWIVTQLATGCRTGNAGHKTRKEAFRAVDALRRFVPELETVGTFDKVGSIPSGLLWRAARLSENHWDVAVTAAAIARHEASEARP